MSPSVANPAVLHGKATTLVAMAAVPVRCTVPFVQSVATPVRFPLNPATTVPFTAATASVDNQLADWTRPIYWGVFYFAAAAVSK